MKWGGGGLNWGRGSPLPCLWGWDTGVPPGWRSGGGGTGEVLGLIPQSWLVGLGFGWVPAPLSLPNPAPISLAAPHPPSTTPPQPLGGGITPPGRAEVKGLFV